MATAEKNTKPLAAHPRSDLSTVYTDTFGRKVTATTHLACNGLGCSTCDNLGFTKTVEERGAR